MRRGGSVADSAIAALLCEGVSNPQSLGVGGGFILTIYTKSKGKAEVLNARECAPTCASREMFGQCSDTGKSPSHFTSGNKNIFSYSVDITSGGLSVAVPGELKGYWELHRKYGKLDWCDLFTPTIKLLQRGIYVSSYLANMINTLAVEIITSPSLKLVSPTPQTDICD